jgi:hypothetical protein
MELRQEVPGRLAMGEEGPPLRVEPPPVSDFLLLGRPVEAVEGPPRRG